MITLYQYEISPFCDKVRRVLHLKSQPYEVREVTLFQTGRGYLNKLSDAGKLPVIEHDDHKVADSTDIIAYLDEAFPEPRVIPTDPRQRALAHVLEDWADESLYFYEMYLRFRLPHNAQRWIPQLNKHDSGVMRWLSPPMVRRAVRKQLASQGIGRRKADRVEAEMTGHLDAIAAWLGDRPWVVGDAISIGDIAVFCQLYCIRGSDEGARAIEANPTVAAWMDRVEQATAAPA